MQTKKITDTERLDFLSTLLKYSSINAYADDENNGNVNFYSGNTVDVYESSLRKAIDAAMRNKDGN